MHANESNYDTVTGGFGQLDNAELLRTVDSLRQDILSMSTDIRDILNENDKLQREVDHLKESHQENDCVSAAQRVRGEVDELIRMHEAATVGTPKPRPTPRQNKSAIDTSRGAGAGTDWMKKMMMFMMMAEMI